MICGQSPSPLKSSKNNRLNDSRKQRGWIWRLRLLLSSSLLSVLILVGFAQAQQTPSCTYNGAAATGGLASDCATRVAWQGPCWRLVVRGQDTRAAQTTAPVQVPKHNAPSRWSSSLTQTSSSRKSATTSRRSEWQI